MGKMTEGITVDYNENDDNSVDYSESDDNIVDYNENDEWQLEMSDRVLGGRNQSSWLWTRNPDTVSTLTDDTAHCTALRNDTLYHVTQHFPMHYRKEPSKCALLNPVYSSET